MLTNGNSAGGLDILDVSNINVATINGVAPAGGDVFLAGGTSTTPQEFTGYNQFDNAPTSTDTYTSPTSSTLISKGYADDTYAPLASPALTGTPTAPTATTGNNTTQLATTAFVQSALPSLTGYASLEGGTSTTTQDFLGYNSFANKTYLNEMDGKYLFISSTGITSADEGAYLPYTRLAVFGDTAYEDGNYASFIVGNEQSPNKRVFIYVDTSYNVGVIGSNNAGKSTLPTCIVNGLGVSSPTEQYVFTPSSSYALDVAGAIHTSTNIVVDGTSTLTGTATAPTPTTGDNSTNIATTAFVQSAITGSLVQSPSYTHVLPASTTLNTIYLTITGIGTITQNIPTSVKGTLIFCSQTSSDQYSVFTNTIDFTACVYVNSTSNEYGNITENYNVSTTTPVATFSNAYIAWNYSTSVITIGISVNAYSNASYASSINMTNLSISSGSGLDFNTIVLATT